MDKTIKLGFMADKLRKHSMISTTKAGSGHPTTCMSSAELMSVLFFSEMKGNDDFIMSKGHAAPILWGAYVEAGIIKEKELMTLRDINSRLEGHPTPNMPLIKVATGSLGQGLSAGVGMALAKRVAKDKGSVFVLLGDGECAEGSVWEATNTASQERLDNLVAIVDVNRLGQSRPTMHGHDTKSYKKKFEAFGWKAKIIDGHNVKEVLSAFAMAKKSKKPFAIIAKTFKGKGVSFLENKEGWHGVPLKEEELEKGLLELGYTDVKMASKAKKKDLAKWPKIKATKLPEYKKGDLVASRDAFGEALAALGKSNKSVVAIDGDVGNSTKLGKFMDKYPERSFQTYIAEQNMAGMAVGFSAKGYIPFISTFAAFLTRAHDFIRMGYYSKANVNIVGSHAGISIGEDGASQMGLEDISMFISIPDSVIVYPSDAVSTAKLTVEMAKHTGTSYMRTTRGKTPVLYSNGTNFPLGKFKVLKKSKEDHVLLIGAGITLHECLAAYEKLKTQGINARVIDLYSVKPLDKRGLVKNAGECNFNVVVVEDHYEGGLGSAVARVLPIVDNLCVKDMPRSGDSKQLLKRYGIDTNAIVRTVNKILKR